MDIRIGKTSRACMACERDFEHDEELFSLIRIREQAFVREDYCKRCWEPSRADDAYSMWTPRFYDPKVAEAEPPETYSPLRQIFYESVEREDRIELATAYLAAQLLRRQKAFRLIKETGDSDGELKVALFADRIGNRLIEVRDPSLMHAEMEEGRRRLLERLNALEHPEAEPSDDGHSEEQPAEAQVDI